MLGIYGAGGLGTEILDLARAINKSTPIWDDIVFIADIEGLTNVDGVPVYALEDFCAVGKEAEVIVALGDPSLRHGLYEKVAGCGLKIATLIHPNAQIGHGTRIGSGCVIQYGVFVSCNVTLGDNVLLQPSCSVGHDVIIGTSSVLSSYVSVAGKCRIGSGTYLGLNCPVRDCITIGSNTIIGMGSVVQRDIPDEVIAMGNPARVIQRNTEHRVFSNQKE